MALSANSWRRRWVPGIRYFSLMMVCTAVWCFLYLCEGAVPGEAAKLVLAKSQYLSIAFGPPLWLCFSLVYTGRGALLARRWTLALWLLPLITMVLVASNELHRLVWPAISVNGESSWSPLALEHGPWLWVITVYSHGAVTAGALLLITSTLKCPRRYRMQAALISVAALLPGAANASYLIGEPSNLDMIPFALVASGLLVAVGVTRFRLFHLFFGLRPVARGAVIEGLRDGVLVLDADDRIVDLNPAAAAVLGGSGRGLLGRDIVPLLDLFVVAQELNGREYELETSPFAFADGGGHWGTLVVLHDVTERMQKERAIEESERRYRSLFDNAHDVIFTTDRLGGFTSVNRALERLSGYSAAELLGMGLRDLAPGNAQPVPEQLPFSGYAGESHEIRLTDRSGRLHVLEATLRPLVEKDAFAGYECIARDATENRLWEEALRHQALHDPVTDLPNRTYLKERIRELTRDGARSSPFALLIVDLDNFKEVNDSHGHALGDAILRATAASLREALPATEAVTRFGGDEFAILVSAKDTAEAGLTAVNILEAIQQRQRIDRIEVHLTASLGIALFPAHTVDPDALLGFADMAMYEAKRAGGGRYAVHKASKGANGSGQLPVLELRTALRRQELTLFYQPLVDLRSGRATSVEALVRWNHPERGLLAPDQFLHLAEQHALIHPLTLWVLRAALEQLNDWNHLGLDIGVSVNVSAHSLEDPGLPGEIAGLLTEFCIEPSRLTLELTERSLVLNPAGARSALEALSKLGVRISLDDFGTGQSTLVHVQSLPLDEIKIDRSFVFPMALQKREAAIVKSIISLAHGLEMRVVGEGVENEATLRLLTAYGCDAAQGYHFGRALPADRVVALLGSLGVNLGEPCRPLPSAGGTLLAELVS